MTPIRTVFLGSPQWAVPSLRALAGPVARSLGVDLVAVFTQPDRPAGRGRRLQPCAVKAAAVELGLPVDSPESMRRDEGFAELAAVAPDLLIVCAYGQILQRRVLDLPRLACWNLHFSLLPRWRGASPVQSAILAGDAETGVALQRMVEALDAGPLLRSSTHVRIGDDETAEALGTRLADMGATVLMEALPDMLGGAPHVTPQDEAQVTVCRKFDKTAGLVDWERETAVEIVRKIRAFTPWPGCTSYLGAGRLGLVRAEAVASAASGAPGMLHADGRVPCAQGMLRLLDVKPEGKGVMPFSAFINGRPDAVGQRLTREPVGARAIPG
jgi:methionyl-tRNA formyltransferase